MAYLLDAKGFIQAKDLHYGSTVPAGRLADRGHELASTSAFSDGRAQ